MKRRELFVEAARSGVLLLLARRTLTSEQLTDYLRQRLGVEPPRDDRDFGIIYRELHRHGVIRRAAPAGSIRRTKGHGTAGGNLWTLAK